MLGQGYRRPHLSLIDDFGAKVYCLCGYCIILRMNSDYFLKQHHHLIFLWVKCCVFFAVLTEL